jgi:hypothetical protein
MAELNQQQKEAAEGFLQFLFDEEPELIISGGGGMGKTYLMAHMIDTVLPQYQATCSMMGINPEYDSVVMTATTNKAAEVLAQATQRPSETIHSFLALKVQDDFSTGRSKLIKTASWQVHTRKIIFIDECSMIDRGLRTMILEGTHKCKIVYVGDHCQLAPVMEALSPIYESNLPFYVLTEPMRNAGQPALISVCKQLRATVETGVFNPILIVPGVIDWLDDESAQREINNSFLTNGSSRILAYTNKRVMEFNDYIRQIKQYPKELQIGEEVINNSMVRIGKFGLSVEEEVVVISQETDTEVIRIDSEVDLEIRRTDLRSSHGNIITNVPIPVDKEHFNALVKHYQRTKNWNRYFHLKNTYPDLRPKESSTVHKSQGSTYDTAYIDLDNLSSCPQPNLAARLLYVAFTRAKNRVVLFGKLSEKYGGLYTV